MSHTVDIEGWGPIDTASNSSHEVILDSFLIDVLCYFSFEFLSVESDLLRVSERYTVVTEGSLMLVEKVVHFPEFSLSTRSFSSLSRGLSKLVNVG